MNNSNTPQPAQTVQKDWDTMASFTDEAKTKAMFNLALSLEDDLNAIILSTEPTEATATAPSVSEAARECENVKCILTRSSRIEAYESIITRITGEQAKRIAELEADKQSSVTLLSEWLKPCFCDERGTCLMCITRKHVAAMKEQP